MTTGAAHQPLQQPTVPVGRVQQDTRVDILLTQAED